MKKIVYLFLCIIAAICCLAACGGNGANTGNTGNTGSSGNENTSKEKEITGITFTDARYDYDGEEHSVTVAGTLPTGVSVSYTGNKGTNSGTYNAKAVLSGEGYTTKELTATLTINKLTYDMQGIAWDYSAAFTYDGTAKTVALTGTLPSGVSVTYTNNTATNAGDYTAKATFTYDTINHNAPSIADLNWKINKAEITGITFSNNTVFYDGEEHSVTVAGTLPTGVSVAYTNNSGTQAATYNAVATLSGENYVTKTLTATLVIKLNLANVAATVWESICNRPDPWSFIPEKLRPENIAYTAIPISDFTSFQNVSSIGKKPIGRQFNVLYDGLTDTAKMLGYFDSVYAVGTSIAAAYQTYINSNENNYKVFEFDPGAAGGFHGKITLTDNVYELLIGNSSVSLELTYNIETMLRTGRIQATNGVVLKYESNGNTLDLAIKTTVSGAGNLKKVHFVRNGSGNVDGYYYEYTGTTGENGKGLKTSAAFFSNQTKFVVVSNKRELEDLSIQACEEVYSATTGEYIGSEVEETVKSINYDTLWFMLPNVGSGLTTIKAEDKTNGDNLNTIYINEKVESIHTKLVGGIGSKMLSRRFDIEMRDVWYIVRVQDGEKVKYESQKVSIPMLFVQKEQTNTFSADFSEKNGGVSLSLSSADIANITNDYAATKTQFVTYKAQSSVEEVETFIGNKNAYFENADGT